MPAVGVVDADALLASERPSPAAPSTFAAALFVRFCFEACLTRDMVASSVSSCENAPQECARRNRRARVTCAIKCETSHRVPIIFMNEIETYPLLVEPSAHMQQHGPVCQALGPRKPPGRSLLRLLFGVKRTRCAQSELFRL